MIGPFYYKDKERNLFFKVELTEENEDFINKFIKLMNDPKNEKISEEDFLAINESAAIFPLLEAGREIGLLTIKGLTGAIVVIDNDVLEDI